MFRSAFGYCVFAATLVWLGFHSPGWAGGDIASAQQDKRRSQQADERRESVRLKKPDLHERPAAALVHSGVLVALIRSGLTTFHVLEASSGRLISIGGNKETGALNFSSAPGRLAYLVREGPNPARNTIEIFDWRNGKTLVVEPGGGQALLGFALDPEGKRLGYAAMNLAASRSTSVTWHVGIADLERAESRIVVSSDSYRTPEEGIPVPFAWSSHSAVIYLQGWLPFRGMIKQSVWSMNPQGAKLAKLIAAPDSIGTPRLSADGLRLAYLSSELDRLPAGYLPAPGAPPGNVITVMDVVSGATAAWARAGEGAFGSFAWSANGEEVLAWAQAWINGRFRDVELRRITKSASFPLAKTEPSESLKAITDIVECRDRAVFWVEKEPGAARLYRNREQKSQAVLDSAGGAIQLLGCVNR